jgi:hypothetical protein
MFQDVSDVSNSNFLVFQPVLRLFFHTQNEPTFVLASIRNAPRCTMRGAQGLQRVLASRVSQKGQRARDQDRGSLRQRCVALRAVWGEKTDWTTIPYSDCESRKIQKS